MMRQQCLPIDEIVPIIAEQGLQDPVATRSRLAFLHHKLRAPFVYAYYAGEIAVHTVWQIVPRGKQRAFWDYLYGNMHTPTTLAKFWTATTTQAG